MCKIKNKYEGYELLGHKGYELLGHKGYVLLGHEGYELLGHEGYELLGHKGYELLGNEGYVLLGYKAKIAASKLKLKEIQHPILLARQRHFSSIFIQMYPLFRVFLTIVKTGHCLLKH